jgi:acetyl-CoA carboxylase carboxyltransferase component
MDKALLVSNLRQRMFADRGTDVAAAWDYCNMMIDSIPGGNEKIAARTALHVLANTVANAIEALPEYIEFLREPRIEAPDNPEPVMLTLDRAALDEIIDARINSWYENDFDMDHEVSRVIDDYDFSDTVRDIVRNNITFSIDVD